MFVVHRSKDNPILVPDHTRSFESYVTFNPCPIRVGDTTAILYRAQSDPESYQGNIFSLSSIGKAVSRDGIHFRKREQFIAPEMDWERYGCEDPRVTKIDGKYFIFYTALSTYPFSAQGIKVAVALSPDLKKVSEKHLVTPFNAKAMCLFPEKINGKYVALLTIHTDQPPTKIALAEFSTIEEIWSEKYWTQWLQNIDTHILPVSRSEGDQIEVGAVPIKTKYGWLLIYSHIKNYMSEHKIFGVEALLLDIKKPKKIIGKTNGSLLSPEESYEKYGTVSNIVFPSGAMVNKDILTIYYGATDTTCACAHVQLSHLLESMIPVPKSYTGFVRLSKKPIITSRLKLGQKTSWEAKAVFNPAAILIDGKISILYRAMSYDNTSVMGYAEIGSDGKTVLFRDESPVYTPRLDFEDKRVSGGNSGCEDPRLIQIKDTIYMYYTAYNGINAPSVAMTSIPVNDFKKRNWVWSKPVLVTATGVDDKDACIHPEKVRGKYFLFHRVHNMICGDFGSSPSFPERNNFRNIPIIAPRKGMWDSKKVGMSVPPIKTKKGWLLLYHGISEDGVYRVGACLLDLKDPTNVLSRTTDYIFEPKEKYEREGQVGNVVFPCGAVVKKDVVYMYYGGADSVVNVASMPLKAILEALE